MAGVRVENTRQFGRPWLALHLIRKLQLDTFLQKEIPEGREHVPWDVSSLFLIIARLLRPSSELCIAEQWYRSKKEEAMTQRFETKIQEALVRLKADCEKKNRDVQKVERQIGRLLVKNSRAAKLFDIMVSKAETSGAIVELWKVDGSRN